MGGLDQRSAGKDEQEARQKREIGGDDRGNAAGKNQAVGPEQLLGPPADEADEGHHHDERTRRGFPEREPVDHLRRGEPLVVLDAALVDVGQHGVGAAEREQRGLGEEPAHLGERPFPAGMRDERRHDSAPEQEPDHANARQARPGEEGVLRRRRVVVDQRRAVAPVGCAMAAADGELVGREPAADVADDPGADDDQREGQLEREDRNECRGGDRPQHAVLERARADAVGGEHHDRRDCRLDAVQNSGDRRHVAERHVDPRQRDQDEKRRQEEQRARDDAAPGPVHHPADVSRKLGCLRPRQHHAVVERVQEPPFRNPAPAFHQVLMHDGDLAGGAPEADEAELEPVPEGFPEGNRLRW